MKKNFAYGFLALCAVLVFWACGEGSLEWAEDEDYLAIEKFESISDADVLLALEQCEGNSDCIKEITQAFRDNPITRKDSTDDDEELDTLYSSAGESSSSVQVSSSVEESSSSEEEPESSAEEESSNSEEESSSSGILTSSATIGSSSSVEPTSSDDVESSSSEEDPESSSSEEEPESSSEEEPESSSSEEENLCTAALIETSVCASKVKNAYVGDEVTWTLTPPTECADWTSVDWVSTDAGKKVSKTLTATFVFSDPVSKTYPKVTFNKSGVKATLECKNAPVTITVKPVSSSSTVVPTSSGAIVPISSGTVILSSSSVKPKSSAGGQHCEFNPMTGEDECTDIVSSSSVTPPPSSSSVEPVVSSSSVTPPPSSSSEEPVVSSSSEEPPPESSSSEETITEVAISSYGAGGSLTLSPGSYSITCTEDRGELICTGSSVDVSVGGASKRVETWGSDMGACRVGSPLILVTTSQITCRNDW